MKNIGKGGKLAKRTAQAAKQTLRRADKAKLGFAKTPENTYYSKSLSGTKKAVKKAQEKVGGKLPKGKPSKFGSPQAGNSKKGYRLDPPHPNAPKGSPETGSHVNWWDYTKGKRGKGGRSGTIPIED